MSAAPNQISNQGSMQRSAMSSIPQPRSKKRRGGSRVARSGLYAFLISAALFFLLPL